MGWVRAHLATKMGNSLRVCNCMLPQNALRRDCNDKCIEWIKGHYLEVMVEV